MSFTKIEDLCDDLYPTGHIETVGQCMEVFRKSVNNEWSNYFVEDYTACEEIKEALEELKKELRTSAYHFDGLVTTLFFFLPDHYRNCFDFIIENKKFQENFDKIKQCFVEDFINCQKVRKL